MEAKEGRKLKVRELSLTRGTKEDQENPSSDRA
jgi:hypothetical protein